MIRIVRRSTPWARSGLGRAIALLATTFGLFSGALVAEAPAQSEVLQGTATTISGQASNCSTNFHPSVGVTFNAAGSAIGPYPGQFTENNAVATVSGLFLKPGYMQLRLGIPFTINSGATTITGTITNPYPWFGGVFSCGAVIANYANYAKYSATIESPGQLTQTISGTAQFRGTFSIQPGAQTTVIETLTFP